jgi:hypothetical protein
LEFNMKRFGLCLVIVLLSSLLFAADWEGTGKLSSSGLLPDEGYYIASNAFPRNTIVDLTNTETRQTVRVIVASGLDSPGMLAIVSRDAANMIGLSGTAIGKIRLSLPNDLGFSGIREDTSSRSGDPDHDSLAAVNQTMNPEVEEFLAEEPAFVYPTEIDTSAPESTVPAAASSESFTPPTVTSLDDSVSPEIPPQPMWVYPQEVDETGIRSLAAEENLPRENLAEDGYEIIPSNDDDFVFDVAENPPEEEALAVTDPLPPEEIYEAPDSSIVVTEPEIAEEDFPETNEPPLLIGEEDPFVAVIPSAAAAAESSLPPSDSPEEVYETPNSSISIVEPGVAAEDLPETSNPPLLIGDENPSVSVIPSSIPSSETKPLPAEEIYDVPQNNIAVVEPGPTAENSPEAAIPPENPRTEADYAFVPAGSRPPENNAYYLPSEAEISPLPETRPASAPVAVNVPAANTARPQFSVESISALEPGAYYVQLGAFSESDSVEQVIEDVGSAYPLKVQSGGSSAKPVHKVLLGPVNIGEGSALLRRFKTRGYSDSFIIPNIRY